jgi:hypothetical protein
VQVPRFSSECYFLLFYVGSITVQIFVYCWFGNEVDIKVGIKKISLELSSARITKIISCKLEILFSGQILFLIVIEMG